MKSNSHWGRDLLFLGALFAFPEAMGGIFLVVVALLASAFVYNRYFDHTEEQEASTVTAVSAASAPPDLHEPLPLQSVAPTQDSKRGSRSIPPAMRTALPHLPTVHFEYEVVSTATGSRQSYYLLYQTDPEDGNASGYLLYRLDSAGHAELLNASNGSMFPLSAKFGVPSDAERILDQDFHSFRPTRDPNVATITGGQARTQAPERARSEVHAPTGSTNFHEMCKAYSANEVADVNMRFARGKFYQIARVQIAQVTNEFIYLTWHTWVKHMTGGGDYTTYHDQPFAILTTRNPDALQNVNLALGSNILAVGEFVGFRDSELTTGAAQRLPVFRCVGLGVAPGDFFNTE